MEHGTCTVQTECNNLRAEIQSVLAEIAQYRANLDEGKAEAIGLEEERDAAREEIVFLKKIEEGQAGMVGILGEKKDKAWQCQNEALCERNEARKRVEELEETIVWIREKIKNGDVAWEKHEIITKIQKERDQAKTILASAVLMLEEAQTERDAAKEELIITGTIPTCQKCGVRESNTQLHRESDTLRKERDEATARANKCVVIVDKMTEEQFHTKTELKNLRVQCVEDKKKITKLERQTENQCLFLETAKSIENEIRKERDGRDETINRLLVEHDKSMKEICKGCELPGYEKYARKYIPELELELRTEQGRVKGADAARERLQEERDEARRERDEFRAVALSARSKLHKAAGPGTAFAYSQGKNICAKILAKGEWCVFSTMFKKWYATQNLPEYDKTNIKSSFFSGCADAFKESDTEPTEKA